MATVAIVASAATVELDDRPLRHLLEHELHTCVPDDWRTRLKTSTNCKA